jgi:hypothetical protein
MMVILPFVVTPSLSITNYFEYLRVAHNHGLSWNEAKGGITLLLFLVSPLIIYCFLYKPALTRADKSFFLGLLLSSLVVCVISSKPGSGPNHFLPLLPSYIYGLTIFLKTSEIQTQNNDAIKSFIIIELIFLVCLYGLDDVSIDKQNWISFRQSAEENIKISELTELLKTYPDAPMGISDDAHYADSYYRVLNVFNGAPLPFDPGAWMDMAFGGVPETPVLNLFNNCKIPVWIIPSGDPFSMPNWYTHHPMFSTALQKKFVDSYTLAFSTAHYNVWKCHA